MALVAGISVAAMTAVLSPALASDLKWDADGNLENGVNGGTGAFNKDGQPVFIGRGIVGDTLITPGFGNSFIFSATPGTVTLLDSLSFRKINFLTGGYTLTAPSLEKDIRTPFQIKSGKLIAEGRANIKGTGTTNIDVEIATGKAKSNDFLTFEGDGTFSIGSALTYRQNTAVQKATLEVGFRGDSHFANSKSFTIASGGTLKVKGNVFKQRATMLMANGTLAVEGSVNFHQVTASSGGGHIDLTSNSATDDVFNINELSLRASESQVSLNVGADGSNDKINIAGFNAQLKGVLNIVGVGPAQDFVDATSDPLDPTLTYTLIDVKNPQVKVLNQFSSVQTNLAFLDPTLTYTGGDGNDVVLTLTNPNPIPDFTEFADSSNTQGVAKSLEDFDYSSKENSRLTKAMLGMTKEEARQAVEQMSGEGHGTVMSMGGAIGGTFAGAGIGRVGTVGTSGGGGASVNAYAPESRKTDRVAEAFEHVAAFDENNTAAPKTYALWTEIAGAYNDIDGDGNASGLQASTGGVFVGAELLQTPTVMPALLGVFGGYSHTNFDSDQSGFDADSDNFHIGIYGGLGATKAEEEGFGFSAAVSYTFHHFDTERTIVTGPLTSTASGDYDGGTFNLQARARYGMAVGMGNGDLVISPLLGFDYARTHTDSFTETGAGALNLTSASTDSDSYRSVVGLEFASAFQMGAYDATANLAVEWRHEFGDTNQITNLSLSGSTSSFFSQTPTQALNSVSISGGTTIAFSESVALDLAGRVSFSETSQEYVGSGKLRFLF